METTTCTHRIGDGSATDKDRAQYATGDECLTCGCTLGSDGYWYIERDEAPTA